MAATMTLQKERLERLVDFMKRHNMEQWFVAKDQGAYIGASNGKSKFIVYFKGCDPRKDAEWWETSSTKFGGDDFGEILPREMLEKTLAHPGLTAAKIKVTSRNISIIGVA